MVVVFVDEEALLLIVVISITSSLLDNISDVTTDSREIQKNQPKKFLHKKKAKKKLKNEKTGQLILLGRERFSSKETEI